MKKIIDYSFELNPAHEHDCNECLFLFGIRYIDEETNVLFVDVYRQCGSPRSREKQKYLIRYSSDGPDYSSGLSFRHIIAVYGTYQLSR